MKTLKIFKINDEWITTTRYEIWKNGSYYASNLSVDAKNRYVEKFKRLGYTIENGKNIDILTFEL